MCVNFSLTRGVPIWKCAKSSPNRIAVRAKTYRLTSGKRGSGGALRGCERAFRPARVPAAAHISASATSSQYAIGGMPPLRRARSLGVFAPFIDVATPQSSQTCCATSQLLRPKPEAPASCLRSDCHY